MQCGRLVANVDSINYDHLLNKLKLLASSRRLYDVDLSGGVRFGPGSTVSFRSRANCQSSTLARCAKNHTGRDKHCTTRNCPIRRNGDKKLKHNSDKVVGRGCRCWKKKTALLKTQTVSCNCKIIMTKNNARKRDSNGTVSHCRIKHT